MKIVGLDLSLTSTGVAIIHTGDSLPTPNIVTANITSKGHKDATLEQRGARLKQIVSEARMVVGHAALTVIEGPSFGQARQGGQHDRAGLWWLVVESLMLRPANDAGLGVVEVPPACRAKYATGKGNAAKDAVLAAVVRRYSDVDINGNDQADALILAAMGSRALGHPIDDLPKVNLEAMEKVAWPEGWQS